MVRYAVAEAAAAGCAGLGEWGWTLSEAGRILSKPRQSEGRREGPEGPSRSDTLTGVREGASLLVRALKRPAHFNNWIADE